MGRGSIGRNVAKLENAHARIAQYFIPNHALELTWAKDTEMGETGPSCKKLSNRNFEAALRSVALDEEVLESTGDGMVLNMSDNNFFFTAEVVHHCLTEN